MYTLPYTVMGRGGGGGGGGRGHMTAPYLKKKFIQHMNMEEMEMASQFVVLRVLTCQSQVWNG